MSERERKRKIYTEERYRVRELGKKIERVQKTAKEQERESKRA